MTFEIGSTAYIVESNRIIREVTIVKRNGDFYIIRFGTRGGIQVRSNRLFASYEDADSSIHKKIEKRTGYRSTYDYIHESKWKGIILQKNMIDNPLQILYTLVSKLANKQAC
mgnify:CR=1 FL=1